LFIEFLPLSSTRTFPVLIALIVSCLSNQAVAQTHLTLEQAVAVAQSHDPWQEGNRHKEQAVISESVVAGTLPDPVVSVSAANLPIDTFDLGQEPMTQMRIGISQAFPRGDTRGLKQKQLSVLSEQFPYMRMDRHTSVRTTVSHLWLEVYRNQQAIRLTEENRAFFEHLVDVAESNYTSTVGSSRQQDLIRANLELTRLEDRLVSLQQLYETNKAQLLEWLPGASMSGLVLSDELPNLELKTTGEINSDVLTQALLVHPRIEALNQEITSTNLGVELARQKYKPQWGVNAAYAYRDEDPLGNDRSDFFSIGVSFDLPLFTANRQDKQLEAAQANEEAIKTEKALLLRSMRSGFESSIAKLKRLEQRRSLYEDSLLHETQDQADAALAAYANDVGDFAEVMRAQISELDTQIDFLNIQIDRLKTIAELNYFLSPVGEERL
jgi:outer membrane protein TolC